MPMAKRIHLLLNPKVYPTDWQGLCGVFADDVQDTFTTDFNDATCNDCRELELYFVHTHAYGDEIPFTELLGQDVAAEFQAFRDVYNELTPEAEGNTL